MKNTKSRYEVDSITKQVEDDFTSGDLQPGKPSITTQLAELAELLQPFSRDGRGLFQRVVPLLTPEKLDAITQWLREKREEGTDADVAALQFNIGMCYARGLNVPQDSTRAVLWYRNAAENGSGPARFALDWCFCNAYDVTVPEEWESSGLWDYERPSKDFEPAQEIANALKQCRAGVKRNIPEAINNLAGCYALGRWVKPNYTKAVRLCRKAAKQGLAEAECNLGLCYANGHGVEQSYAKAYDLFRKAADRELAVETRTCPGAEWRLHECLQMRLSPTQEAAWEALHDQWANDRYEDEDLDPNGEFIFKNWEELERAPDVQPYDISAESM